MEKFKNFFYNKNDIIVAILILTIAVFVIAFRIKSLMDYRKTSILQLRKLSKSIKKTTLKKLNKQ